MKKYFLFAIIFALCSCSFGSSETQNPEISQNTKSQSGNIFEHNDEKKSSQKYSNNDFLDSKKSQNKVKISCEDFVQNLSLEEKIGQVFMLGWEKTETDELLFGQIQKFSPCFLLILGNRDESIDIIHEKIQTLKKLSKKIPLFVAVDQEGGYIQRLKGRGFSKIPSAQKQGEMNDSELVKQWEKWGKELVGGNVDFNLAPVADFVPKNLPNKNEPIAKLARNYSYNPTVLLQKVKAVIEGLGDAKILVSIKHFPGIGYVKANTDFGIATDNTTNLDSESLKIFENLAHFGVDSIMISSVIYEQLDSQNPAVFSQKIIQGILREKFGYSGVIISDDIGNAVAVEKIPARERGVKFLQAGGDIIINANPQLMQKMYDGVLEKAKNDTNFAENIEKSIVRVLRMKSKIGEKLCE